VSETADSKKKDSDDYDWVNAPTIRTDSVPIKKYLLDGHPEPEVLEKISQVSGQRLRNAALRVNSIQGPMTLFVYGGTALNMGRARPEEGASDVCLRLRPTEQFSDETQCISSKHLGFTVAENGFELQDIGSSGGTILDDQPLLPEVTRPLSPGAQIKVADVLRLQVFILPRASVRELAVSTPDAKISRQAALFIERPDNGQEHAYALVPGRLVLSLEETGRLRGATGTTGCDVELFFFEGVLWLCGGHLKDGQCEALVDGGEFSIGTIPVSVRAIQPDDQI
jgi:hypothetical protein